MSKNKLSKKGEETTGGKKEMHEYVLTPFGQNKLRKQYWQSKH